MAQRVNVVLVDDLDGADAAETVTFALDGVDYEIDLTKANADKLRQALSAYTDVARRTGGRRKIQKQSPGGTSASEIRQWARENGWDVPERGRVASEVREAYNVAH